MKTDGEKLDLLADWIDTKFPNDPDPEVQEDLRRIATRLHKLDLKKKPKTKSCSCEMHDRVYYGCRICHGGG